MDGQRALREEPTARAAVEAMLRKNAEIYADPDKPSGCMVVLGTTTWTPHNEAGADVGGLAAYYNTVLEGLSVQARDGASLESMRAIIDYAMAGWRGLTPSSQASV